MKPSDFYTRTAANQGAKMELMRPDGTFSKDDYLVVRSVDSDEYRKAKDNSLRIAVDAASFTDKAVAAKAIEEAKMDMYASLVADWSFEEEMTQEALREFLTESPNNMVRLDRFASDRTNFFTPKPQS